MASRAWLIGGLVVLAACTGGQAPTPSPVAVAVDATSAVAPPAPTATLELEPSASTVPTPAPLPADLPDDIRKAIAWRLDFGLHADPEWVMAVHADPTATDAWDYPILPEEEDFIFARQHELLGYAAHVRWHAGMNREVYGGLYYDNGNSQVMSLWTEDPEGHLAAILQRAGDDAPIAATRVRWSEAELDAAHDRIEGDHEWFTDVDAGWEGSGIDISGNRVEIEISSANPEAPRHIAERLARTHGLPVEMFSVVSDGTGIGLLAKGGVRGVVVTADGSAPGRNDLWMDGDPQGVGICPNEPFPANVDKDGSFELWCTVGTWRIQAVLWDDSHEAFQVVGESAALVEIRKDRIAHVRVRLERGAPIRR